jgi:hypothetical protein
MVTGVVVARVVVTTVVGPWNHGVCVARDLRPFAESLLP